MNQECAQRIVCFSIVASAVLLPLRGEAVTPVLPYSLRTHGYSAWDTSVRGDLRTVGMAGAMVGLADSRIGSVDNPAGLPMTLDSTGIQFTGNSIQDGYIQTYPSVIDSGSAVITACYYPWGLGMASWSPQGEGEKYQVGGTDAFLSIKTREYRISGAHLMLGDQLSLGAALIIGENTQVLDMAESGGPGMSRSAWAVAAGGGALVQLPHRWLLGLNYTPPMRYTMDQGDGNTPGVAHFFQSAQAPYRLGAGVGWVPNRFFRIAGGLYVFGTTENIALLSDDSREIGQNTSLQPRLGISYLLAEYKEFKVELAAGAYLEVMRVSGDFSRLHGTVALEFKPWIFNIGWGIDESRFYQNFIYTAGIDVAKVLRKLDLIPQEKHYPYAGLLPDPTHLSEEGLPRALRQDKQEGPPVDVVDVGLKMPGKLRQRILDAPEDLMNYGRDFFDSIGTPEGESEGLIFKESGY